MNLPNEITTIIFSFLPITDKRNLFRTSKQQSFLSSVLEKAVIAFHDMIQTAQYVASYRLKLDSLCKFTIELFYDNYPHLVPARYLDKTKCNLHYYPTLYFNIAARGQIELIKLLLPYDRTNISKFTNGAASTGNLTLLKWLRDNHCPKSLYACEYAAENGHMDCLKWLIDNGYNYNDKT